MASITLTIKDESSAGAYINEVAVSFTSELSTIRDIIKHRVLAEVEQYNKKQPEYLNDSFNPVNKT